ncbi:rapamycin-insensitive companion of mTOR-like isoform 2-T2 [Salvelinus alpinus]
MKTGSLDSRLMARRFLKALSFASLDKEDLLSPINQSTLHRSSSVRSMVSSATYGCNDDYVGLALPMDINDMFHIRDAPYFQQKTSLPADDKCPFYFGDSDSDGGRPYPPIPLLKQQFSISELMASRENNQNHILGPEETGLQEHTDDNCLYCVGTTVLGHHTQPQINNTHTRTGLSRPAPGTHWAMAKARLPGLFGPSSLVSPAAAQGCGKGISDDGPACRVLLRKEVLRLVINRHQPQLFCWNQGPRNRTTDDKGEVSLCV